MVHRRLGKRHGFTLVEALVLIALILVLLGLLAPAVMKVRESASVTECQNNLRQLGTGFRNYEVYHRKMPPYSTGFPPGTPAGNWLAHMLPFMEAEAFGKAGPPPPLAQCAPCVPPRIVTSPLAKGQLPVLHCHSDPSPIGYWSTTNYLANWYALSHGSGGYFAPAQQLNSLSNGLTHTVIFAEAYRVCDSLERMSMSAIWYHNFGITQQAKPSDDLSYLPNDYTMFQVRPRRPGDCDKWRTQTPHAAMNVCLADGSVRTVQAGISPQTWKQVLKTTPWGGPLGGDW
jgi:hypothetical protein